MNKSKNHKHTEWEVITHDFKDRPAKVVSAKCSECGVENPYVLQLFQDNEDKVWKAYGSKPPIVWLNQLPEQNPLTEPHISEEESE